MSEPREWLIRKNGYFYRPNRCGYTIEKAAAGRYTKAEADREAAIEPENFKVLHESEVPDAPQTTDLKDRIAQLERELADEVTKSTGYYNMWESAASRADIAERELADTRERSAEWAKSFARKCVEAVALETENSRLQSEYASLLETVTRKVNEKIEAERDLAEARQRISELEIEVNFHAVKKVEAQEAETRLQEKLAEARAELDRLKKENHDLGNEIDSLEEEGCDADDTIRKLEAERERFAAEVENLPFSVRDIKRGLILFRTSNNAHDYTNFVSLTAKVDALPQVAKDELAQLMRVIADGLSPARASLQNGEKG